MTSFLEECTFGKTFTSCLVCGDSAEHRAWSSILLQSLFVKALQRIDLYDTFSLVVTDSQGSQYRSLINAIDELDESLGARIDEKFSEFPSLEALMAARQDSISANPEASHAIFITSISELLLAGDDLGAQLMRVTKQVQNLHSLYKPHTAAVTTAPSSATKPAAPVLRWHVFASLQTSLHPAVVQKKIQGLFHTVVHVTGNDGSALSTQTVAAEIHTIRRAERTHKIQESEELAAWTSLSSVLKTTHTPPAGRTTSADDHSTSSSSASSITRKAGVVRDRSVQQTRARNNTNVVATAQMHQILLLPIVAQTSSTNNTSTTTKPSGDGSGGVSGQGAGTASAGESAAAVPATARNKMLITFDRTDPEFGDDADEDPDADLDL